MPQRRSNEGSQPVDWKEKLAQAKGQLSPAIELAAETGTPKVPETSRTDTIKEPTLQETEDLASTPSPEKKGEKIYTGNIMMPQPCDGCAMGVFPPYHGKPRVEDRGNKLLSAVKVGEEVFQKDAVLCPGCLDTAVELPKPPPESANYSRGRLKDSQDQHHLNQYGQEWFKDRDG